MTVVADTSAMLALVDSGQGDHRKMVELFRQMQDGWILPAATLPELDYLIHRSLGGAKQQIWMADLAAGVYQIEWHGRDHLRRAVLLNRKYQGLGLGYVDSMVMATAETLGASAIATLDLRHFGSVALKGNPRLLPRDA